MASLSHFIYQNLFLPLATVFAFVSLYISPLFDFITTFVLRLRRYKAPLNKNSHFPETEQQLGYDSDVFKDVSEFQNSENNGDTEETEFNFTFKFPTYEEFCKSKEDKVGYVRSEWMPSTFNIKSLKETEVVKTEDSKEVHSNIAALNEEDKTGDLSNLECDEEKINEEEKGDLSNLECDKEEMNSMKGESNTRNEQFLKEVDFTDDSLFQSEKDSISTDSDTVSIGFDHMCYLMNKLVDSYSDGFLTDEDFGGEFELDDVNDLEMSEENQESYDSDTDIMKELRKLDRDQAQQFLSEDDFHEDFYKLFGDSEDTENTKSRNEDVNNLETLWEHQELIEQLKMEFRKVKDTGLPTILEESDALKMEDLAPWKIDEKLQRQDCMSELHKFYKSYRERMRKFDILTYQKMYAIEDRLKDKNKGRCREKNEYCITSDMLVEIVEESIRIFWQFVRADRNCSSLMVKGKKGTQHQELIKSLGDLELLMEVKNSLRKKEKNLKDAMRDECCILKRFKKHKEDDSNHVLYFFSQVDMKLVTRVLNMSRLTTDQLVWCHNKLSSISFLHRKIHVDPSILLFPC